MTVLTTGRIFSYLYPKRMFKPQMPIILLKNIQESLKAIMNRIKNYQKLTDIQKLL